MKLIRYGNVNEEKPGLILSDGRRVCVSHLVSDYDEDFFANNGIEKLAFDIQGKESHLKEIPEEVRLGAPLTRPSKIVCIGLNYSDHAAESGMEVPSEPVIFFKATSAMVGPNDDLIIPKGSQKTDWEVELAVVIKKHASYVKEEDALDYVAGYTLHNDYSEREYQLERSGQWVKGKSCDTFAPVGPFIATPEEIKDVNNLEMWLKVNGCVKQQGNSSTMVFKVPFLISYLSQFMSLLPGDIISTGTPPGVGLGFNPPQYLKKGDLIELGIESLGSSMQKARCYEG